MSTTRSQVKDGASLEKPTELEKRIINQIEHYFGDANLPRDKFMLQQRKLDNGWIPMSIMLRFNQLARISKNADVIVNALKFSQLIEVYTTGSEPKMRRFPEIPLPDLDHARQKAILERSVYCKGFPKDAPMTDIVEFFKEHGMVERIHLRKYKDYTSQVYYFKGSVFATFCSRDGAQAFLDKESVMYGDTVLVREWQKDYLSEKANKQFGRLSLFI